MLLYVCVQCHSGLLGSGHYTCMARRGGRWIEFNDDTVRPLNDATAPAAPTVATVAFFQAPDAA